MTRVALLLVLGLVAGFGGPAWAQDDPTFVAPPPPPNIQIQEPYPSGMMAAPVAEFSEIPGSFVPPNAVPMDGGAFQFGGDILRPTGDFDVNSVNVGTPAPTFNVIRDGVPVAGASMDQGTFRYYDHNGVNVRAFDASGNAENLVPTWSAGGSNPTPVVPLSSRQVNEREWANDRTGETYQMSEHQAGAMPTFNVIQNDHVVAGASMDTATDQFRYYDSHGTNVRALDATTGQASWERSASATANPGAMTFQPIAIVPIKGSQSESGKIVVPEQKTYWEKP